MKTTLLLASGLAAALSLSLTSCGDKESSTEKADQESKESKTPESADTYPLTVCVVSGEELGSMGKPVVIGHNGTEVRFCCKDCVADFNKEPEKYLAMLKAGTAGEGDNQ